MSYQDKLALALKLVDEHNAALDPSDEKIVFAEFELKLKKLGGSTESALRECTWEDLEKCGLPRILARKVASGFRADPRFSSEKTVTTEGADGMHPLYLLQSYNPQDPDSNVGKRLKELSRGKSFIVFKSGSSVEVNAEASHKLLQEIMRGFPAREEYEIEPGRFVRTYAVGETVGETVDENPLYPGRALRDNGFCDQTNRSWDGVPQSVRQLVYLAVGKNGGVNIEKAHDVIDIAVSTDGERKLRQRYSKVATQLDEMIENGTAPILKVKLGANASPARVNNPFGQHRQY